jgi:cytoskeletal protein RodZ
MAAKTVGGELRDARRRHGLTQLDIANRTNIPPHLIDAIERNALEELPGGLISRGHLRAFAGEVRVDAERLIVEGTPDYAAQTDLLDLMRIHFGVVERERGNTLQVLLVVACILGLLYATSMHYAEHTASAEAVQQQSTTPEES